MAWPGKGFDKDEVAKELFGVDAATVQTRLAKLDSIEGTLSKTSETLTSQNELIEKLTNTVKELRVSSPYDTPPRPAPVQTQTQLTDWGEDADKAFQERSAPIVGTVLDTRAMIAKRNVMENLREQYHDWHLFSQEIDDLAKTASVQQRVQEDFWRNCYFVVKGKHHDDIIRDQNQKSGKFWSEPASSSVVVRGDENKNPVDLLTSDEKKMAEGLGVPLEVYAKNRMAFGGAK